MAPPKQSPTREARIHSEIVVDAYDESERAMGWYYYLEEQLRFPFRARCIVERATSPVRKGEQVTVIAMAREAECEHEMFVCIKWPSRSLAIPLVQLNAIGADSGTRQAIADWRYWVAQGYEF